MKILITGAAGGIGSSLGYQLNKNGHELILVDNLRNGYIENLRIDNQTFGKFYQVDINSDEFHDIIKNELPETLIHLAAITSLPDCEVNYRECLRVNVEGTSSVLGAAAKYGVKKVIFGSTSAVYENTKINKDGYKETDGVNPRLFYSLSKKMAEEICLSFRQNYDLNVVILRFFNVFGPRQDIHRKSPPVINYIVREMMNNQSPVLHSDGLQSRDYIFVDDVVSVIEKVIEIDTKEFIFNLSSNTQTSLNDIVESVKNSDESFQKIEVVYREPNRLWDSYPELFSGKKPLKKEIIEKETKKVSLGNNDLLFKELKFKPSSDIKNLICKTSNIIKKSYLK
jgi:UDP-glucose 4-epimerase